MKISVYNPPIDTSENIYQSLADDETTQPYSDSSQMSAFSSPGVPMYTSSPVPKQNKGNNINLPLRIVNINFQSIKNKKPEFLNLIDSVKPDIIIGTESWLTSDVYSSEIFPPSFTIFRKDRQHQKGGGVFIAVRQEFQASELHHINISSETLWIKVKLYKCRDFLVCAHYRPHVSDVTSITDLRKSLDQIGNTINKHILIAGDFNLPGINWEQNSLTDSCPYAENHRQLINFIDDFGLCQLVKNPTRGENILDLMLVNNMSFVNRVETLPGLSDHDAVFTEFDLRPFRPRQPSRKIPVYERADWLGFKNHMLVVINNMINSQENPEALWTQFKSGILSGIEKFIPHKNTKQYNSKPWISKKTRALISKRDKLYTAMRKTNSRDLKRRFKQIKREIQKTIRRSYWDHIDEKLTSDDPQSNNKRFWSYVKNQKQDRCGISVLKVNGKIVNNNVTMANALNDQFNSVFSKREPLDLKSICKLSLNKISDSNSWQTGPTMPDIFVSVPGVKKLLNNLNPHKAMGPDGIGPRVLKELSHELAPGLCHLFQKSLDSGIVPSDWKTANVSPVFKKGQRYDPANYRPISLTCVVSKVMEHIIVSNVMKHASRNNILYDLQHGFRSNRSCETQLIQFSNDIIKTLSSGTQVDALIMDFSKAFDKVDHQRLITKLSNYGVKGNVNSWIRSFLSNRTQRVVINGEKSDIIDVSSGVPQGSVLGPCLFLFYINDIADNLKSTTRLFADDTISYIAIKNTGDCNVLQNDLDKLGEWEEKWHMEFHPDKCNVLRFSRNRKEIDHQYFLHGHQLKVVDKAKYLGITFTKNFSWNSHVDDITSKANKKLGFLRRNLNVGSISVKEKAYKTLVRPSVEYASCVWNPHTQRNIQAVEMVQRRAARFVTHRYRQTSSVNDMISHLTWRSLQNRRFDNCLNMFYKIVNKQVAIDPVMYLTPSPSTRSLRHNNTLSFQIPFCKQNFYLFSFFPATTRLWNGLSDEIVTAPSVAAFHNRISIRDHMV